jgi:DNA ligase-1
MITTELFWQKRQEFRRGARIAKAMNLKGQGDPQEHALIKVLDAEITLSPIYMCAMDAIRKGSGLAIRFPSFTGNYRLDKAAEDAITADEVVETYQKQPKKSAKANLILTFNLARIHGPL